MLNQQYRKLLNHLQLVIPGAATQPQVQTRNDGAEEAGVVQPIHMRARLSSGGQRFLPPGRVDVVAGNSSHRLNQQLVPQVHVRALPPAVAHPAQVDSMPGTWARCGCKCE